MIGTSAALEVAPFSHAEAPARSRGRLVRVWTARIANEAQYLAFAHAHSLPMFLAQPGCEAVHFLPLGGGRHAVVTLWTDDAALQACEASPAYDYAVAALMATGLVEGDVSLAVTSLAPPMLDVVMALLEQRPAL